METLKISLTTGKILISKLIFIIGALLIAVSLAVGPGLAQEPPEKPPLSPPASAFVPGEIVVKFQPHVSMLGAQGSLRADGLNPVEVSPRSGLLRVQVTPGREAETIAALMARGDVEIATYNYQIEAVGDPNDPDYPLQWALKQAQDHDIDAPEAWDIYPGGNNVIIAVIDSGVDLDHPDLQANIVAGHNFVNDGSVPDDDHGHGTHVAGIAAAIGNNGIGIAGINWSAKIMPLKVLNAAGSGTTFDLSQAINYAADNGAKVINMSVGAKFSKWPCNWPDVEAALNYAASKGVLMVVAAGNDDQNGVNCPGAYDQVMAVGSTTSSDTRSSFSNYGPRLDIAAPGSIIYSTLPGSYGYNSGTSMATPYVAGLASLIWSYVPSLTDSQVRNVIQNSADDLGASGWDQYFGYGRINARAALEMVSLQTSPPQLTMMIDDDSGPVSGNVQVMTANPDVITWTATLSPTVPWLSISQPISGTISSSSSPDLITLIATTATITYSDTPTTTTVIVTGTLASGIEVTTTSQAQLIYAPEIFEYYFPIMFKN